VHALILADGPTRYLGGSIMTFALPYGAFIVIAGVLFYIYRRPHSVPRLKYLRPATQTAVATREPGTPGLISVRTGSPNAEAKAEAKSEAKAEAATAEGPTEETE
jgi:hypothetical protein